MLPTDPGVNAQSPEACAHACIFWDNSNVFIPAQEVARERDGAIVGRDLRIQFSALYQLARAGRRVVAGVCVGSIGSQAEQRLWDQLRGTGVALELFERGQASGREQAVDQALQVHMLRAMADHAPGVAVLLTGDGAGHKDGRGYFADLQRMHRSGWRVEVLSWRAACHGELLKWAEEHGRFIALDDYYESITFIRDVRPSRPLARQSR